MSKPGRQGRAEDLALHALCGRRAALTGQIVTRLQDRDPPRRHRGGRPRRRRVLDAPPRRRVAPDRWVHRRPEGHALRRVGPAPRHDGLGHKPPIPRHPTRSPYAGENPVPLFNVSYLILEPRREPHRRLRRV